MDVRNDSRKFPLPRTALLNSLPSDVMRIIHNHYLEAYREEQRLAILAEHRNILRQRMDQALRTALPEHVQSPPPPTTTLTRRARKELRRQGFQPY